MSTISVLGQLGPPASRQVLDDEQDAGLLYLIERKSAEMREAYGFVPPFLANTDILLHLSNPDRERGQHCRQDSGSGVGHIVGDEGGATVWALVAAADLAERGKRTPRRIAAARAHQAEEG